MLPDDPNLPRWQPVAISLATGATVADAAAAGAVHASTVRRWLRRPAFNRRVQEIRDQAISAAVGKLTESCLSAAETLRDLLSNSNPVVRLGAARALLYSAMKGREHVDGENRIRELTAEQPSSYDLEKADSDAKAVLQIVEWAKNGRRPDQEPSWLTNLTKYGGGPLDRHS